MFRSILKLLAQSTIIVLALSAFEVRDGKLELFSVSEEVLEGTCYTRNGGIRFNSRPASISITTLDGESLNVGTRPSESNLASIVSILDKDEDKASEILPGIP